ncbi:MAG: protein kinase [Ruminiclostridium sp.]|nr:protein kinase [Ruminiclostridium sp.]
MDKTLNLGYVLKADEREYTIVDIIGRGANTTAYISECNYGDHTAKCILKEYAPHGDKTDDFEHGKARFLDSAKQQNKIRQLSSLTNQTPPVCHIFEANGTAYSDVAIFNGNTLNKLLSLSTLQYMEILLTIAKTVAYYHKAGFLCLDLKPENIFVLQNTANDTITQLVEFIDFDSIRETSGDAEQKAYSYTRDWAAPEQINPYSAEKISAASDIYAIGEIAFFMLFGRHSKESEHRGFSKYPFDKCKQEFRKYAIRTDICNMFTELFRNTLRSSPSNRYSDIGQLVSMLEKIVCEFAKNDYIIPRLPAVSPIFVGRDSEMNTISERLADNRVLFINGIGGIGKSTLVRNYIGSKSAEYDVIVYLEYENDLRFTFADDMQLQISTMQRQENETFDEYFERKLKGFKNICADKKVLFVIDNYTDLLNKDLQKILDCEYDTIVVTRRQLPINSFAVMTVEAITDKSKLYDLIELNLGRKIHTKESDCVKEIIDLVQGHTLVLELIARQIAAGKYDFSTALALIRANGFSNFSDKKIGNYKDGEEVYDTLSAIITALFDASRLSDKQLMALKTMSLFDVRGFDTDTIVNIIKTIDVETLRELQGEGWLYLDERVRVHTVIAETMRNLPWADTISDKAVMKLYKNIVDLYKGTANAVQMNSVIKQAETYSRLYPRHFIKGMYYDMLGSYYDVILAGAYVPYTEEELKPLDLLIDALDNAIGEMQESDDPDTAQYLAGYYLSLANVFIRIDPAYHEDAAELLDAAADLIEDEPKYSENRCYLYMTSAWYTTLVLPSIERTKIFTEKAEEIAKKIFSSELEIIDIVYIPTANCWYYHDNKNAAAEKLTEAVEICRKYPDKLPYIDKQAELLNCLLDVYYAMDDIQKCCKLITEVDRINDEYKEQGVFREVNTEIRKAVTEMS